MDTRRSSKILQKHMPLLQEVLVTPTLEVKQETIKKKKHCAQTLMFCLCPMVSGACFLPLGFSREIGPSRWSHWEFLCGLQWMAQYEGGWRTAEQRWQLQLMKTGVGIQFNSYHLSHLSQYFQAWGPINTIKEWKFPWMTAQIQTRIFSGIWHCLFLLHSWSMGRTRAAASPTALALGPGERFRLSWAEGRRGCF